MRKKIISIVGARPQFVKIAPIATIAQKKFNHIVVNTGQHYDYLMSSVFFKQLFIPKPKYNLGVGSGTHAVQTGKMLIRLEKVLYSEKPHLVLIYGDTNSTLAGALVASKLNIPFAHIEAGMRSFNRSMPEELNRIVADHLSSVFFCFTKTAVHNLKFEGLNKNIHLVDDIMFDTLYNILRRLTLPPKIFKRWQLKDKQYSLLTIHRAENTDNKANLYSIFQALRTSKQKIIFPVHPRTRRALKKYKLFFLLENSNIILTPPVSYIDMIELEKHAKIIITDSGGVQKESEFLGVPCITLRKETEWVETVEGGWNTLVGCSETKILNAINNHAKIDRRRRISYDQNRASKAILHIIDSYLGEK